MEITVNCYGVLSKARVIISRNSRRNLCYVCTDFEVTYCGKDVKAHVYEDIYTGDLYAVID